MSPAEQLEAIRDNWRQPELETEDELAAVYDAADPLLTAAVEAFNAHPVNRHSGYRVDTCEQTDQAELHLYVRAVGCGTPTLGAHVLEEYAQALHQFANALLAEAHR